VPKASANLVERKERLHDVQRIARNKAEDTFNVTLGRERSNVFHKQGRGTSPILDTPQPETVYRHGVIVGIKNFDTAQ